MSDLTRALSPQDAFRRSFGLDEPVSVGRGSERLQPYLIEPEQLAEVLAGDPSDAMVHGKIRGLVHRLERQRSLGRATPQLDVLRRLLETPVRSSAELPAPYEHPMRVPAGELRPLTAGDIAFVESLRGKAPHEVTAEEATELARLDATAESRRERMLVAQVSDRVRAHHDREAEKVELRRKVAQAQPLPAWCNGSATVTEAQLAPYREVFEDTAAAVARAELAEALGAEVPAELRDQLLATADAEARREAFVQLRGAFAGTLQRRKATLEEAEQRLRELAMGAAPAVSSKPELPTADVDNEGVRRARAERERRDAQRDAFAAFTKVGE